MTLKPFLEDMLSMSTGTDGHTLQIHFSRPVTVDDRLALMDAHNYAVTRPTAPVEGLERYGQNWHDEMEPKNEGDYVLFSQAEAIIAVERAMRKTAEQRLAQSQDDLKQVRADNAALTVEIERLQKINAMIMGDDEAAPRYTTKRMKQEVERATQVMRGEASDREAYVRSLETQLAAARKALEEIASFTQTTDLLWWQERARAALETAT
ncbi:hypothetical protein [Brucella pituitosa]|uniref:Uncharacterized protein n=1 Tax=Brucella pituitosa TaxID=571256 RepID=A0A643F7P4_9HYPH|nr:hypothetical protein [Brucella pituitosa]KAB0573419.1 hypothetical protein F7Q93_02695 [Brucella pituitosa]